MANRTKATLLSDKPIFDEDSDELHVGPFADAIAKAITDMTSTEAMVIGVEGKWGAGKSSAIELACRRIVRNVLAKMPDLRLKDIQKRSWPDVQAEWSHREKDRPLHLVRFNPWIFSGQENLVKAFFNEVGTAIGHSDNKVRKVVARMRDILPAVGAVAGGVAVGALTHGLGAPGGTTGGKNLGDSAKALFPPDKSLEQLKRELASALLEADKRIVVIIDDLDRLVPAEIRQILSMVKALGDLPNVVYLLAYDREVVTQSLGSKKEYFDQRFLDKIVQVPIKLPPASGDDVRSFCFARLNQILGDDSPIDASRWSWGFRAAFPYLRTPRDVTRLANTLQMLWPIIRNEADFTDLFVLTVLQMFEPTVYAAIANNIETIVGENDPLLEKKILAAQFEQEANPSERAKELVAFLFPKFSEPWKKSPPGGSDELKRRFERRISTREYYRNFFAFSKSDGRVTREEIDGFFHSPTPSKTFSAIIRRLSKASPEPQVAGFLEQIFEEVSQRPLLNKDIVRAFLDESDELLRRRDTKIEFFARTNLERLEQIFLFGLRENLPSERSNLIDNMISYSAGFTFTACFVDLLASEHGLFDHKDRPSTDTTLEKEDTQKKSLRILAKLRALAKNGKLLRQPMADRLIWQWWRWTGNDEVSKWLDARLTEKKSLIRLAEIIPQTGYSSAKPGDGAYEFVAPKVYGKLFDVDEFEKRLKKIKPASPETKAILEKYFAAERNNRD